MPKEVAFLLAVMMTFVAGVVVALSRRLQQALFALLVLSTMRLNPDVQFGFIEELDRHQGTVWGFRYTVTDLLAFTLLVALLVGSMSGRGRFRMLPRGSFAIWALIAAGALSMLNADFVVASLFELHNLLLAFVLFVAVANYLRTEADLRFVMGVLMLALAIPAFEGFRQHFQFLWGQRYIARVRGTTAHPNILAMYLNALLPLCLVWALTVARLRTRLVLLAVSAFAAAAVMFTLSRGGVAGLVFGCGISLFLWLLFADARGKVLRIVLLAMVFAPVGIKWTPLLLQRFHSREAAVSVEGRERMTDAALETWGQHPLLGIGTNNYAMQQQAANVHNSYMLFLTETGLVGVTVFVLFLLRFLWMAFAILLRAPRGSPMRLLGIGLTGGLACLYLQLYAEFAIRSESIHYLFFVLAGVLSGTSHLLDRVAAPAPAPAVTGRRRRRAPALAGA